MQQPAKYFHKRLNSTNLYANEMLRKQTEKEPFWIRTDDQFAGRGQGNNTWITEPRQNLTGTLVIFPQRFEASRQFLLSEIFSLAAARFLELFIEDVRIKWPNDLYAGDRKIGGILIETAIQGASIDYAILGVGMNVNQLEFPAGIPNPVSLSRLTGLTYDLSEMEDLFLESFLNQYSLIESASFEKINIQYVSKLYRFEEFSAFKAEGKTFDAKITGITEYGHLILQNPSGSLQTFAYREVEYIL